MNRPAAIPSAAPGAASTAPDGQGRAFGGSSDWLVQTTGFSSGGWYMYKYKKLETFLAPAINQPKALKIKLFASMLSSSRKQHMNHYYQENFNVGLAYTSVSWMYHLSTNQNHQSAYNIYQNGVVDTLNATGSNPVRVIKWASSRQNIQNCLDLTDILV